MQLCQSEQSGYVQITLSNVPFSTDTVRTVLSVAGAFS